MPPAAEVHLGKESNHVGCLVLCTGLLCNCDIGFVQKMLTFAHERRDFLAEMPRRLNAGVESRLCDVTNDCAAARKIELRSAELDFSRNAHDVSVFGLEMATSK